jgi:malate/lactate dehydrogenase
MQVAPAASYADLDGSDVVVITAGVTLGPGQTRLDLLSANASTIVGIVGELDRACPEAVVILVTNPVESVHAYVVGEHGDSSFPVWSSATVGAVRLEQFGLPEGRSWPQVQDELAAAIRGRGRSIHERKEFTSCGVAAAVARIVRAVARDEKRNFHGLSAGRRGVRDRASGAGPAIGHRIRWSRPPAPVDDVSRRASDARALSGNSRSSLSAAQIRRRLNQLDPIWAAQRRSTENLSRAARL